jgi:short-subunit dehydrogenase involved in D-alanine esterification of teichoic acids
MTVLVTTFPGLQVTAVTRAGNLRRFEIPEVDSALDDYADTYYHCNSHLTERERICRLANQLSSLKDLAQEVKTEIDAVVKLLRRAFNLFYYMEGVSTYDVVMGLIFELDVKYPKYNIHKKLRTYTRFVTVHRIEAVKVETAQMVAELLVIGMNADTEGFRDDLEQTIQKVMKIMMTWM